MRNWLVFILLWVGLMSLAIWAKNSSSALVVLDNKGKIIREIKKLEDLPNAMTVRGPAEVFSERYALQIYFPVTEKSDFYEKGPWDRNSMQVFRAGYSARFTGEDNKTLRYLVVIVEDSDAPYLNSEMARTIVTLKK